VVRGDDDPVGVLGFSWGGGVAYWAACHLNIDAAASVYGARLPAFTTAPPKCPLQLHYAERDVHGGPHVRAAMEKTAAKAATFSYDLESAFDRLVETPEARDAQRQMRAALVGFFTGEFAARSGR
ncbi:MAG: dienelactone hydrolase family protein, partial [Pseudomonadota bacterium]